MTYYAITGLGWGRGEDAMEAITNYRDIQKRNFRHLSEDDLREAWGFLWKAPEGATGFRQVIGGTEWTTDGDPIPFAAEDKRADIGNVPEQFRL